MASMDPFVSEPMTSVPQALLETVEWLLSRDEFPAVKALVGSIARGLPQQNAADSDYLASVLHRSKHYPEATQQALHTLRLRPNSVDATFNLAKCFHASGDPAQAEVYMAQVVHDRPDWIDPQIDLAVFIAAQGRFDEAMERLLALLSRVPEAAPHHQVIQFNLGWHYLRKGEFKKGMRSISIGRQLNTWGAMEASYPRPKLRRGVTLAGQRVLIVAEGGVGDEIINSRFASVVKSRGGEAYYVTQPGVIALFARMPAMARVFASVEDAAGAYDYWAPAMELPSLLDLDLKELPQTPYLTAAPSYIKKWQQLLPPRQGRLRVGLRWQGQALYEKDLMRSIPFAALEALATLENIELYSLQCHEGSEHLRPGSPVVDLSPHLNTWDDTAAAIHHLDLVISSCTSVPHLAAAMHKPTWVLCPLSCYYVWATPGDSSPWYPSVRLFRQSVLHSWDAPMTRVEAELATLARDWSAKESVRVL